MSHDPQVLYEQIAPHINAALFDIPPPNAPSMYFPDRLNERLDNWFNRYQSGACQAIDAAIPFANGRTDVTLTKCRAMIDGIKSTVANYFMGDILEATQTFYQTMDDGFKDWAKLLNIPVGQVFFRARISDSEKHYERKDLFHLPFELRHLVATNRYSVPGFPALYLGDSAYVCWEEYDRHRLRDLTFAAFENKRDVSVIDINLFKEFNSELSTATNPLYKIMDIMRYVCTYPLILACTCLVFEQKGSFKPEYIVPQLLLQYVSQQSNVDGVKFPSSRINYGSLQNVKAYNYVFPVKTNAQKGYCNCLKNVFDLTQPTSLEFEEVINNPMHLHGFIVGGDYPSDEPSIEVVRGVKSFYRDTSFGKIEGILKRRSFAALD